MASSSAKLKHVFFIRPEQMLNVRQRLPVTSDFYVPIQIFDVDFTLKTPTIEACGEGAVRMALDRSFGFARKEEGEVVFSQKTDGLILRASNGLHEWHAALHTPDPISDQDVALFSAGVGLYASHVFDKINPLNP